MGPQGLRKIEVGAAFRERLVPHGVLWFTGEAMEEQAGDEDEEDEEEALCGG